MIYQEDPFQQIVNVGWGTGFAVLSFRALWRATLDFPNNPFVGIGDRLFRLYDNPASIVDGGVVYVSGNPIYRAVTTSGGKVVHTTFDFYYFDATSTGPGIGESSAFTDVHVTHTFDDDGNDFWSGLAGVAPTLADYVALAMAGFSSYEYHNVRLISTSNSTFTKPTIYDVEENALVFVRLPPFKSRDHLSVLSFGFDTGLRPFPDETFSPFYKWQATVGTFRSATLAAFADAPNNVPGAWMNTRSASLLSFGNISLNQTHEYFLEFDIDLTTLAVTGSQTLTG